LKFLISPGFAKSGTTSIFTALRDAGAPANFPRRKETDYLRVPDATLSGYLAWFPDYEERRVFVDVSPQYDEFMPRVLQSASAVLGSHEVAFLYCMREPAARGFSHYLYDLSANFFVFGFGRYPLHNSAVLARYFPPMAPSIRMAGRAMPMAKIFGYALEHNQFSDGFADYVGLPPRWVPNRQVRENRAGYLPQLFYDRQHWVEVVVGDEVFALPPRTLLFSSGGHSKLWRDFPDEVAERLLAHSASWTRQLEVNSLRPLLQSMTSDYVAACSRLGIEPSEPPEQLLAAGPPPLPAHILDKLRSLSNGDSLTTAESIVRRIKDIDSAFMGTSADERLRALRYYLNEFGPSPRFLNAYVVLLIDRLRITEMLELFHVHPSWISFVDLSRVREAVEFRRKLIGNGDAKRIQAILDHATMQDAILPGVSPS
jgi:hypothetical protein